MSYGTFYAGLGTEMAVVEKPVRPDLKRQIAAAGPVMRAPGTLYAVAPDQPDDLAAAFGPRLFRAMMRDPAVCSSLRSLKLSALDGGMTLRAPDQFKAPAWYGRTAAPKAAGKPGEAGKPARTLTPEQQKAQDVLAFCNRLVARVSDQVALAQFQQLDMMIQGCKLTEFVYTTPDDGVDKGKLVWSAVSVKPNANWRFVVDDALAVRGILTWDAKAAKYVVLKVGDPLTDKFIWHSWMPEDSDPRGTSQLEAAVSAWNLRVQSWPMYYQHLVRFGSPGIDATLAEGDNEERVPVDANGKPIQGEDPVSPAEYMTRQLQLYKAGGIITHPYGSEVKVYEPRSQGEAFSIAADLFAREIKLAIEYQVRASMEAQHGSRADSQTAADEKDVIKGFARDSLASPWRKALRDAVAKNFGTTDAELFTPLVSFGQTEKPDRPATWTALSELSKSGYIGDSQKEELDAEVGLPVRDSEADQRAEQQKAERDAELAAKAAPRPAPGAPGDTGKAPQGGGKPAPAKQPAKGAVK